MFSYLAFKGLTVTPNGRVSSPQQKTEWRESETPWGTFLYLAAYESHLDRGFGIFAASYDEAACYSSSVFLCAPDPRYGAVIGESGWRAEAAMALCQADNKAECADIIIRAHLSGYPQVPKILNWAWVHTRNAYFIKMLKDDIKNFLKLCNPYRILNWVRDDDCTFKRVFDLLEASIFPDDPQAFLWIVTEYWRNIFVDQELYKKYSKLLVKSSEFQMRLEAVDIAAEGRFYDLWRRLADDPDPIIRRTVAEKACSFYEQEETFFVLCRYTEDEDSAVRREAVRQLAAQYGAKAVPILRHVYESGAEDIRLYAAHFYYKLTGNLDFLLSIPAQDRRRVLFYEHFDEIPLVDKLYARESDVLIRRDLLAGAFRHALVDVGKAASVLRVAAQDADPEIRRSVVRFVSDFCKFHFAPQALVKILDVLRSDEVEDIRSRAEKIYQQVKSERGEQNVFVSGF